MITIDNLLLVILQDHYNDLEKSVSKRTFSILNSLKKSIESNLYITENQGKLLLKIFKENSSSIISFYPHFDNLLHDPSWSKDFRPIDRTKRCFISSHTDYPIIIIETSFSSALRKAILHASKHLSNFAQVTNGKLYHAELTEKNVVYLVELLSPLGFDIDEKLKEYYDIIKTWTAETVSEKYQISTMPNKNFYKHIGTDLSADIPMDHIIFTDRSIRYQYNSAKTCGPYNTLTSKIANRDFSKVWVGRNEYSLTDIFNSLVELKRFPALVVFDSWDACKCTNELKNLITALNEVGITDSVGIYFRLSNDDQGKEFNTMISSNNLNAELCPTTRVVGVQSGKIPKFFINNSWTPMSVISIGNSLKHSKTAVYANRCDLIITYSDFEPMIEPRNVWE